MAFAIKANPVDPTAGSATDAATRTATADRARGVWDGGGDGDGDYVIEQEVCGMVVVMGMGIM